MHIYLLVRFSVLRIKTATTEPCSSLSSPYASYNVYLVGNISCPTLAWEFVEEKDYLCVICHHGGSTQARAQGKRKHLLTLSHIHEVPLGMGNKLICYRLPDFFHGRRDYPREGVGWFPFGECPLKEFLLINASTVLVRIQEGSPHGVENTPECLCVRSLWKPYNQQSRCSCLYRECGKRAWQLQAIARVLARLLFLL